MIRVLIQAEAGSCDRQEHDERTLESTGSRRTPLPYPYPYGFVLGTNAADGGGVDCYLITRERLAAGTVVDCEPFGLLLQMEGGEADHKVLASLPGQTVLGDLELLEELQRFIYEVFAESGDSVEVGPILPREAALRHLEGALLA